MKLSLIYFIILVSLLYNVFSESIVIFERGGNITVEAGKGKVVFNATNIEENEEISFEIKAQSFNNEKIKYEFSDDNYDLTTYTDTNAKTSDPYKKEEADPNFKYYYYKIKKII